METKVMHTATDEQLVEMYKKGDSRAMGLLYERYSKKVYAKCWTFAHDYDIAYDLSHDIMLKAFEKLDSFKGNSSFSTWLYSVTFNYCVEYYRKNKKYILSEINDRMNLAGEDIDYDEVAEQEKKKNDVISLLEDISEADKEMLVMKYQQGYSLKQLQATFKLGESAVKMRLSRAKTKVEKLYNLNRGIPVAV